MIRSARTWDELLMRVAVWLVIIGLWGLLWCAFAPTAKGAGPADDEAARAAVAVELAKLALAPAPVVPVAPLPGVEIFVPFDPVQWAKAHPDAPQPVPVRSCCPGGVCPAPAQWYPAGVYVYPAPVRVPLRNRIRP